MFNAVCDCCGKEGGLHHYMLRMEKIEDPSISIKDDFRKSEVIPFNCRKQFKLKLLLYSKCYNKTGLQLFSLGDNNFRDGSLHFKIDGNKTLIALDPYKCKYRYPFTAIYKDLNGSVKIVNVIGYSSTIPGFIIEDSNPGLDTHWFSKNLYVYKEELKC